MAGYYKRIKGKNYDREMLDLADELVAGVGDGRISMADAQRLLDSVKDANSYTDIEKRTMKYIRDNYKFTKEADQLFRTEIRSWAAQRGAADAAREKKKQARVAAKRSQSAPKSPGAAEETPLSSSTPHDSYAATESREKSAGGGWWKWLLFAVIVLLLILAIVYFARNCSCAPKPNAGGTDTATQTAPATNTNTSTQTNNANAGAGASTPGTLTADQVKKTVLVFSANGVTLAPASKGKLDLVAKYMKENSSVVLNVIGHTCSLGTDDFNKDLGIQRARAVASELKARGTDAKRIKVSSRGESEPIASNDTKEGRAKNRRVQFRLE